MYNVCYVCMLCMLRISHCVYAMYRCSSMQVCLYVATVSLYLKKRRNLKEKEHHALNELYKF